MATVQTNLGPIHVEDVGDVGQPTALLWPSLFTDHTMWAAQVAALQQNRWRTLAIDPPGQGKSPGPGRSFTMDECARAAVEVLDALRVQTPALLLGTSWGGMIAPRVALAAPDRVAGLALFNTTAEAPSAGTRAVAILLTWMLRFPVFDTLVNRIVVSMNFSKGTRARKPEAVANFARRMRSWDRDRLIDTVRSVLVDRDATLDRLSGVTVPTLIVSGADDTVLPTPFAKRIAERLPDARRVEVSGCSHLVPVEAPDRANRLVFDLVERLHPAP